MATFPVLKTGAVAQYPAGRETAFANHVYRFVDGSEQRYRAAASPLRKWVIQLSALDEVEMGAVTSFFEGNQGAFSRFSFTDPWDQTVHPHCVLDSDALETTAQGEMSLAGTVTIRELRR